MLESLIQTFIECSLCASHCDVISNPERKVTEIWSPSSHCPLSSAEGPLTASYKTVDKQGLRRPGYYGAVNSVCVQMRWSLLGNTENSAGAAALGQGDRGAHWRTCARLSPSSFSSKFHLLFFCRQASFFSNCCYCCSTSLFSLPCPGDLLSHKCVCAEWAGEQRSRGGAHAWEPGPSFFRK